MSHQFDERRLDLAEHQLRAKVLIPLFIQMGFQDVIEYHGTVEKGKDIICRFRDLAGDYRYIGIVVKSGDIHGAVGKPGNASEVLNQAQQTFDEPYTDIFGLKEIVIDECWVVASGEIKGSALESIRGRLKKSNLDKLTRFLDHRKLSHLIDRFLPGFWTTDQALARMAHEMHAPLFFISGIGDRLGQIAKRDKPMDRSSLQTMAEDLQGAAMLMRRMIEVSMHLSMTRTRPRFELVDLNKLISEVIENLTHITSRQPDMAGVSLTRTDRTAVCQCDFSMISLAVWTLMHNAARYGDAQRPGTITIKDLGASLAIEVSDWGVGIRDEDASQIGQPYFRGQNTKSHSVSGSAVSLSVVKRIAAEHSGSLMLTHNSKPTVFTLNLPKKPVGKSA